MLRSAKALRDGNEEGFILIVALLAVAGLSLIAVDLSTRSSGFAQIASIESGLIEAGFASDAGLAKALAALSDDTDPYWAQSMASEAGMAWQFDRATVRLRIQAESGKVDLMVGEIELIDGVVKALVADATVRSDIMQRVKQVRNTQTPPRTISAILPPSLRITPLASRFGECLTVFSGQASVDPLSATPLVRKLLIGQRTDLDEAMAQSVRIGRITPDLAAGLGSRLVVQRPLYTVEVEARIANGIVSRQAALVLLAPGQAPEILRRFDFAPSQETF